MYFLIQKFFSFTCNFIQFLVIKALDPDWVYGSVLDPDLDRYGIQPKMLDADSDEMNADPQP